MPFAAQNQGKRFKNKVVFQSRPYAYESMSSHYSGVKKVCPWNPDFCYILWYVFYKTSELHKGRRAGSCCQSYKWSQLSHEPSVPWALGVQKGALGLQAGLEWLPLWPGGEVQVYHWGQDADVNLFTSAAGLLLTSFFFFPQNAAHFLKQECLRGNGVEWCGGSCGCLLAQSAEESGDIGPDLSTPELAIRKPTRALEFTAVFIQGILSLWPLLNREKKWCCPIGITVYILICWNQHSKLWRNLFHQIHLPNIIRI